MVRLHPDLPDRVSQDREFDASACLNCGVCSAVCPMGIELLPRQLFRSVLLGMEDQLLENIETVYSCLLCKMCEVNCTAGVHIVENVRTLRHYINGQVFKL